MSGRGMIWTERLVKAAKAGALVFRTGAARRARREQERRQTRLTLARREAELLSLFENTIAGKTDVDLGTGRLIRVNRTFCTMLGRTEAELLDTANLSCLIHPDDWVDHASQWTTLLHTGQGFDAERRYIRADGKVIWGRLSVCPVASREGGRSVARSIIQDITPLKEAELALRESQHLLRLSLEIGSVSTFRLDFATALIHGNADRGLPEGTPGRDAPVPLRRWLSTLLAKDRKRCLALFRQAGRERRSVIDFEYSAFDPEHGLRHFETRSRIECDEFGRPVASVGVAIDVTARRAAESRVEHLARHDPLTNLPNRSLFNDRLKHALETTRSGLGCAILMLDLDHFKEVNDTLGHPVGDKLLCVVATRLRSLCRQTDTVARLGGDEFAIVQSPVSGAPDADVLAARIIEALTAPYQVDGHRIEIGTSIGIVLAPEHGTERDRLITKADTALYEAKRLGRGRHRFFDLAMEAEIQQRRALDAELRRAVPAGEMEVFYQPLVGIAANRICGMEALVRWRHPSRGLVMPDSFIPQSEANGVIVEIGGFVLRRACADACSWPAEVMVAVNISASEFNSPGLVDTVAGALSASGLDPRRLQLEITESTILEDTRSTGDTLRALKALGVSISIDDFGTGFSSLSYLQRFAFDKVKIDRSFITPLGQSTESLVIVKAVVGLCAGLNIDTTAEGVETEGQLAILSRLGCTEAQGYHFSRPRPGGEVIGFMEGFAVDHGPRRQAA